MSPKKNAQTTAKTSGGILRSGRFAATASIDVVTKAKSPKSCNSGGCYDDDYQFTRTVAYVWTIRPSASYASAWQLRLSPVTPLSICTPICAPPMPNPPLLAATAMAAATTKASSPPAPGTFGLRASSRPPFMGGTELPSPLPPTAVVPFSSTSTGSATTATAAGPSTTPTPAQLWNAVVSGLALPSDV
ncbi:unnamed protein product [Symbiodinium sp. CCMP2592]|nr:unnamed protein product [Symbiodinium sp. CCMP2592]